MFLMLFQGRVALLVLAGACYTCTMNFRGWLSVFTLIVIAVIIYFSRHELAHAWKLLEQVNIWILLLLIPVQLFAYFAGGEMIFSYLRSKKAIKDFFCYITLNTLSIFVAKCKTIFS